MQMTPVLGEKVPEDDANDPSCSSKASVALLLATLNGCSLASSMDGRLTIATLTLTMCLCTGTP